MGNTKELEEQLAIAKCFKKGETQEQHLKRIMQLPDGLKVKARAIFFARQRTVGSKGWGWKQPKAAEAATTPAGEH